MIAAWERRRFQIPARRLHRRLGTDRDLELRREGPRASSYSNGARALSRRLLGQGLAAASTLRQGATRADVERSSAKDRLEQGHDVSLLGYLAGRRVHRPGCRLEAVLHDITCHGLGLRLLERFGLSRTRVAVLAPPVGGYGTLHQSVRARWHGDRLPGARRVAIAVIDEPSRRRAAPGVLHVDGESAACRSLRARARSVPLPLALRREDAEDSAPAP